jgi:transposase
VNKKFVVRLTSQERFDLTALISKGRAAAFKIKHANILLKADADGPAWTESAICEGFDCSPKTVGNLKQRFVEQGIDACLERKRQDRPSRRPILDGEKEARLIALSCGQPPLGRASWTLRLLADRLVTLDVVDSISHETVRVSLKKTNSSPISESVG